MEFKPDLVDSYRLLIILLNRSSEKAEIKKYSKVDILEVDKNDVFFLMIPFGEPKYGVCFWENQYQIVAIKPKNKNILYIRERYS